MGAFANLNAVVNALTGGSSGLPETIFFYKDARLAAAAPTAPVIGRWNSLWQHIGCPSHGAAPASSAVYPDNTTVGGLLQADHAANYQKWLTGGTVVSLTPGILMLYDRLSSFGGLSGVTTGAQACAQTLSSRYTGTASVGNQMWLEIATAIGSTARTVLASYVAQDGSDPTTSESTIIGGTGYLEAGRMIQIPLASGGTGVRAINSITISASTTTAGSITAMIIRPLAYWSFLDVFECSVLDLICGYPGPIEIKTDACLAFAFFSGSVTVPKFHGSITMCEVAD